MKRVEKMTKVSPIKARFVLELSEWQVSNFWIKETRVMREGLSDGVSMM